jgi:thioredoxin 1
VNITGKQNNLGAIKMKKILRFTASWCQPCKALSIQLEESNFGLPIEVIDIDVHSELAIEYGIRSVPTLIMMDENIEMKRIIGMKTKKQLTEWFND